MPKKIIQLQNILFHFMLEGEKKEGDSVFFQKSKNFSYNDR